MSGHRMLWPGIGGISMQKLSADQIQRELESLPAWEATPSGLRREWKFPGFKSAMLFVNRVAELAEIAKHHPDIDIRYNRVILRLTTHDAEGVTERDLALARQIEKI